MQYTEIFSDFGCSMFWGSNGLEDTLNFLLGLAFSIWLLRIPVSVIPLVVKCNIAWEILMPF